MSLSSKVLNNTLILVSRMELLLSSYLSLLLVQIWFHTIKVVYLLPTKVGISTKNIILIAVLKEQDLNPIFFGE